MNFEEFKNALSGVRLGDKGVPKDDILIPLINESLNQIAREVKPLGLVSSDIRDELLVILNEKYFIRKPNQIVDDNSLLDIDEALLFAVVHHTASFVVHRDNKAEQIYRKDEIVADYKWMRHESSCDD